MSLTHTVYVGPYVEVRPQPDSPSWGDFVDTIRDALSHHEMPNGEHVWMPNVPRNKPRQLHFHPREEEAAVVLEPDQNVSEAAWFLNAFRDEFAALVNAYGEANMRLRWGVLIMTY